MKAKIDLNIYLSDLHGSNLLYRLSVYDLSVNRQKMQFSTSQWSEEQKNQLAMEIAYSGDWHGQSQMKEKKPIVCAWSP